MTAGTMGAVGARPAIGGVDPGLALLQSATLWLDASDVTPGSQWVRNKGTGGRALDARFGSVGRAEIVKGALKLPGSGANNASTPDSAALDVVDDMEIIVRVTIGSTTGNQGIVSKWAGGGNWSYELRMQGTDLYFYGSDNGSSTGLSVSGAHGFTVGETVWIRAARVKSTGVTSLQKAPDSPTIPTTWPTTIVSAVVGAGASYFAGNAPLYVGSGEGGNFMQFTGSVFRAIIRSTIGGAAVFDADFTAVADLATSFTESSANAATVTINATSGVDTNDPILLPHTGTNYLYLPGVGGNIATALDSAALDITGDLDIQMRVALDDWVNASNQTLLQKGENVYVLQVNNTTGTLGLLLNAAAVAINSTVAPTVADGQFLWVRATIDVNDGAGNRVTKFYTAPDAAVPIWTQLGSTVTTAGTVTINNGTGPLRLGTYATSTSMGVGKYARAIIRNGFDGAGSVVFDADFTSNTNQSSFTESSSNAATVTIERSANGRKSVMVARPTLLFGTDDYLEVPDNDLLDFALADSFTVLAVMRRWGTKTNATVVAKTATTSGTGWALLPWGGTDLLVNVNDAGGSTQDGQTEATLGTRFVAAGVRNTVADTITAFVNTTGTGTTDARTATSANSEVLRVGRLSGAGANYLDGEIEHVALFRSALTSTEIGQIMSYLGVS